MLKVEEAGMIRRMGLVKGYSIKEIARRLDVSRNTVRSVLRGERAVEAEYARKNPHRPKLGAFEAALKEMLEEDGEKPARGRRGPQRLYEELQGLGYTGAVDSVQRYARRWRQEQGYPEAEMYVPLVFAPGEAMQFDWSTERAVIGGLTTIVKVAQMRLCHSRMCLVQAFRYERQEMMLEGLRRAFHFFGGAPQRLVVDNLKAAVKKILSGGEREWQARFEGFCAHYLLDPHACAPRHPESKGQVERQVGVLRGRFFNPLPAAADFEELNDMLTSLCIERAKAARHPEVAARTVWEMWEEERPRLIALPPGDYDCCRIEEGKRVDRCGTVVFDNNRYSVPCELGGRHVEVRGYAERVKVVCDGAVVAEHRRLFGRGGAQYDPMHYLKALKRKPGALLNGRPFVEWQMPPALALARAALKAAAPDGEKQFVAVLLLMREWGLDAVAAATELALEEGAPFAGRVENILRRLCETTPPKVECAAVIRLTREPAADPGVYDAKLRAADVPAASDASLTGAAEVKP
jgi:transposase